MSLRFQPSMAAFNEFVSCLQKNVHSRIVTLGALLLPCLVHVALLGIQTNWPPARLSIRQNVMSKPSISGGEAISVRLRSFPAHLDFRSLSWTFLDNRTRRTAEGSA